MNRQKTLQIPQDNFNARCHENLNSYFATSNLSQYSSHIFGVFRKHFRNNSILSTNIKMYFIFGYSADASSSSVRICSSVSSRIKYTKSYNLMYCFVLMLNLVTYIKSWTYCLCYSYEVLSHKASHALRICLIYCAFSELPNVVVEWLTLLLRNWEIPISNHGPVTGRPEVRVVSLVPPGEVYYLKLGHDSFLSHHFQFIIYLASIHRTLRRPSYWNRP
jgi:hypothetical protein